MYQYQLSNMLQVERMTRSERLAADEQAGRLAHELRDALRALVRPLRAVAQKTIARPTTPAAASRP